MKKITAFGCFFYLLMPLVGSAQVQPSSICINQLGYYPQGPKIAVVKQDGDSGSQFFILSETGKDTLYQGNAGNIIQSKNSATRTRIIDFTPFKNQGRYLLHVPGKGNSYPFEIKAKVNAHAAVASLKGYYYQRVSMPLEEKWAGKWHRAVGHPDTAVLIHPSAASVKRVAGTVISSTGGWYDAGDYNKYIVNSGISMGTLLSAYEDFTPWFKQLNTNIPESNNAIPDILDEVLYNLRWMMTMQDPGDGGVYNKCTNADFDGMVMPGVTTLPRYVVQKGTAATLDFASVMAQSARVFESFKKELPGLADSCLAAAKLAWEWALANPAVAYDQSGNNKKFTPVVSTGGYGDKKFADEFFWAACELMCTTGNAVYFKSVNENKAVTMNLPSWNSVELLGYYSLFRHAADLPKDARGFVQVSKTAFLDYANDLAGGMDSSAFKTVMGKTVRDFNWGSNANAANQGIVLINAWLLTRDKRYIDAALSNLDYLLGRNATGYSFLTGVGSRTPMFIHHRPSEADGIVDPVPGLLAGGPNPGKQDKCDYQFSEPETTYADVSCSYASNEIAINWNAPLVYLANAIEALQGAVGY